MVSSGQRVKEEVGTDKLRSPDAGNHASLQVSDSKICLSQSDQGRGTPSIKSEKDPLPDIGVHTSQSEQGGNASSMISKKARGNPSIKSEKDLLPDIGVHTSHSEQVGNASTMISKKGRGTPSIKSEKDPLPDIGVHTSQSEQGGNASFMISKKASLTPSPLPGAEGSSLVVREKVSEDGYNWRKYGQKLVKGNEFVRSYYKCTHPNCQVKKQVERAHDGRLVDTVYFGQHDHPKAQSIPLAVGFVVSVVEERSDKASPSVVKDKLLDAHTQTDLNIEPKDGSQPLAVAASEDVKGAPSKSHRIKNVAESDDDHHISKRRKKQNSNADASLGEKPNTESRMVVKTMSEVDLVNDGYRWRKYGQKLVKGNPNPRSYYRCSNPGCPVKKHVERASHDAKLVITTYEGQHEHDLPPTRTVTHNTAGVDVHSATHNDKSGTKVEESETICVNMVVHSSSGAENKSSGQLNGDSRIKSEVVDAPISSPQSASDEQRSVKMNPSKGSDAVRHDMIVHTKSSSQNTSSGQPISAKVETKSENDGVCIDKMIHITPHTDCNFDEKRMPSTEPVQS